MTNSDSSLLLALAQINLTVGDLQGNSDKIIAVTKHCYDQLGADIVAMPEQAIIGYPAEDLLLQPYIAPLCMEQLQRIMVAIPPELCLILGYPRKVGDINAVVGEIKGTTDTKASEVGNKHNAKPITNHLEVCLGGKSVLSYAKQLLPSYQVFDEPRFFNSGTQSMTFTLKGMSLGVLICEDLWQNEPVAECCKLGAQHIISINASPYSIHQPQKRLDIVAKRARDNSISISYVNCIGGQDELVFDGYSFACNSDGEIIHLAPPLQEYISLIQLSPQDKSGIDIIDKGGVAIERNSWESMGSINFAKPSSPTKQDTAEYNKPLDKTAEIYSAIKCGLHDYISKNNFSKVVLGLSGGIDSALIACLAVDALGAENVTALMLSYKYTSTASIQDANALASNLGINYEKLAIDNLVASAHDLLSPLIDLSDPLDLTAQNIQPRLRALILMALANKKNAMLIATSNKSETAVGYSTLYGDMAGGYAPLKDIFKHKVYELANYRNSLAVTNNKQEIIPLNIIHRPPSAELYDGQEDSNNLPDYDVLDEVLRLYIEEGEDYTSMAKRGFEPTMLAEVIKMVDAAEHKRRQAAPGTRITEHNFGRDRRYPITNKFVKMQQG